MAEGSVYHMPGIISGQDARFVSKSLYMIKKIPVQKLIWQILYNLILFSSLKDTSWANSGHLEFLSKDEEEW